MTHFTRCWVLAVAALVSMASFTNAAEGDWISPDTWTDSEGKWSNEANAFDLNDQTYALDKSSRVGDGAWLEAHFATPVYSSQVRVLSDFGFGIVDSITLSVKYDGNADYTDVFTGTIANVEWSTINFPAGNVASIRYRYSYVMDGYYFWLWDLQLMHEAAAVADPQVAIQAPTSVAETTAVLHGTMTDNGGAPALMRLAYGTSGNFDSTTDWVERASGETLDIPVAGLVNGLTYSVRTEAKRNVNSETIIESTATTFTTAPLPAGTVWVNPIGAYDSTASWTEQSNALDDNNSSAARTLHEIGGDAWSPFLNLNANVPANGVRVNVPNSLVDQLDVDVLRDGVWVDVYEGTHSAGENIYDFTAGYVTEIRVRLHSTDSNNGFYFQIFETDLRLDSTVQAPIQPVHFLQSRDGDMVMQGEIAIDAPVVVDDADASGGQAVQLTANAAISYNYLVGRPGTQYAWIRAKGTASASISVDGNAVGTVALSGSEWTWCGPVAIAISGADFHTVAITVDAAADIDTIAMLGDEFEQPAGEGPVTSGYLLPNGSGKALRELWLDTNFKLNDVIGNPDCYLYPTTWTFEDELAGPNDWADTYCTKMSTYFIPPQTEEYVFWIAADNWAELHLNTGSGPQKICELSTQWTDPYDFDQWPEQESAPITLQAGQPYMLTTYMREDGGLDNIAVAVSSAGITRKIIDAPLMQAPVWVDTATPSAPTGLLADSISDQVVNLSWTAATDDLAVYAYRILRDGVDIGGSFTTTFRDETVSPLGSYDYQVVALDRSGHVSDAVALAAVATPDAPASGTGTGLTALFYAQPDFSSRQDVRVEAVDADYGSGSPAAGVPVDGWSAVWEGYIRSNYDESHTLSLVHDDPVRVYCNNRLLIESNYSGPAIESSGTFTLSSTADTVIRIELFNTLDADRIQLRWTSQSQRSEIVPVTALYPSPWTTGSDVAVSTGEASLVSPAWVEGRVGADAGNVNVTAAGSSFDAQRHSATTFYADNASAAGASYGVTLNPDAATAVSISAGSNTVNQSITWTAVDVATMGSYQIRRGDSMLFTATGGTIELDPEYDSDTGFTPDYDGPSGTKFPHQFSTAGTYYVMARVDGSTEVGPVTVQVLDVDWQGDSIACEIGYRRKKDIKAFGGDYHDIHVEAANPYNLDFSYYYGGVAIKAKLKPIYSGTPVIHARLGKGGPLLARMEVDEFVMKIRSATAIEVLEVYPDDSMLVETALEQMPWVTGLEVRLHIFVVGVTFDDSTIDKTVWTDDFIPDGGGGAEQPYRMIMPPDAYTGSCHTTKIYQNGTQIGDGE